MLGSILNLMEKNKNGYNFIVFIQTIVFSECLLTEPAVFVLLAENPLNLVLIHQKQ